MSICNRYWLTGFSCIIAASVVNIFAIGYGSLVLLASMSAVTILFNSILSVYILNETFTKWDALATLLIFIGCVCSSIFSKSDTTHYQHEQLYDKLTSAQAITYFGMGIAYCVCTFFVNKTVRKRVRENWDKIYFADMANRAANPFSSFTERRSTSGLLNTSSFMSDSSHQSHDDSTIAVVHQSDDLRMIGSLDKTVKLKNLLVIFQALTDE